jgi:transcriptional regulator with XRE-family HTH domain
VKRKAHDSIDAYLKATKSTQEALAQRLGITQSALSMIKNGLRIPRPELALLIHEVTGVPLETLLTRERAAAS